jgi:hypothetical protein
MDFDGLARSLLQRVRQRIRAGELSVRRLAKLADVSQPHMHNVLAGHRGLPPAMADRLLGVLGISLHDLVTGLSEPPGELPTPVLEGPIGGGRAFPRIASGRFARCFDSSRLQGLEDPCQGRVADEETAMTPTLQPGDDILLDCGFAARRKPSYTSVYAVEWEGSSYLCRCQKRGLALVTMVDGPAPPSLPARIPLGELRVQDVVRGQVVWFGRMLTRF